MAKIYLIGKDKRFAGKEWLLDLTKDGGQLVAPDGVVQAQFTHADAEGRFVFPSFWKSIKDLGVNGDDGTTINFQPQRECVAAVKRYLASALAAQGPEEVRRQRVIAWLKIAAGSVLMLAAVPSALLVYAILDSWGVTRVTRVVIAVGIGLLIAGGGLLGNGFVGLRRARQAADELGIFE